MSLGLVTSARGAVSITLVVKSDFAAWNRKQPARIKNWLKAHDFSAAAGTFCAVPDGKGRIARVIAGISDKMIGWDLADLPRRLPDGVYRIDGKLDPQAADILALCWALGGYQYDKYRKSGRAMARLVWPDGCDKRRVEKMATALYRARDMITTPAEDMGPAELTDEVKKVARTHKAKIVEIVGDKLLKENYPLVHTVGRASSRAPRFIDVTWGKPKDPLVVLVGKGVCFDTGGLDLKPSSSMYYMKKDMAGAACALAVADMIMALKLPVRLRLLVPAVENSVSGNAFRPMDVLKSRKGLTVEVGNTDAEGRLILADALTEGSKAKPAVMINFATLTGAARSALGTDLPALFSNDDKLADDLLAAGRVVADPLWRMPLWQPYRKMLDSSIADLNSAPNSPYAGAITAALFLEQFVGANVPWAHIDLMAWNLSSKPGRPEGGEAMAARAVFQMIEKRFAMR